MGDDRPQGNGVLVGMCVKVGVMVGGGVAVLVAGAVADRVGVAIVAGAPQPARMVRSRNQEKSLVFELRVMKEIGFIVV
jgi:hypothetical protein